jgi:glucose-1-phosphate cytidylyltransferase
MVCNFSILDAIEDSNSSFENDVLPKLAAEDKLYALEHNGFWQAMDTLRERNLLENLWESGAAPWKIWS